ncbi:hypothetical protein [Henriciella marina]|nr:hypothetical protein [Henriciella marina]
MSKVASLLEAWQFFAAMQDYLFSQPSSPMPPIARESKHQTA